MRKNVCFWCIFGRWIQICFQNFSITHTFRSRSKDWNFLCQDTKVCLYCERHGEFKDFFSQEDGVVFCNVIILYSVRQHNYFITQSNYIGYMIRPYFSHLQDYFCHLSHQMLCTLWDPIVFTAIKLNNLSQRVWRHILLDKWFNFVYSMDVSTMGSQSVHSILWLKWQK